MTLPLALLLAPLALAGPSWVKRQDVLTSSNSSSTLESLCTTSHITSLVSGLRLEGASYDTSSLAANVVTNFTATADEQGPFWSSTSGLSFCNVSFSLTHTGINDNVALQFYLPDPLSFKNRWLSLGGGGWSVSGANNLPAGLVYGAASGATDGGFGSSGLTAETLMARGNGTTNWDALQSFAYAAIHEMTVTGKALTSAFYNASEIKSYYMGCSEGGREGHQSTQRYPTDFDGVFAGAPAIYWPIHQLAQGWPNMAMAAAGHWPSPCAFKAIMEDYIAACDPLDGATDGVVSRSDLCNYNASASVGKGYANCSASMGRPGAGPPGAAPTTYPAGTISQADADVVDAIYRGAFNSAGEQVFWAYRPGTSLSVEAGVTYDNTTGTFGPGTSNFFGTYYQNLVRKSTADATVDYGNITVDALYDLMVSGLQAYGGWLETTWPDLSAFRARGGKLIHWHGEQDTNLFPEASAAFHEKVRATMFPSSGSGGASGNGATGTGNGTANGTDYSGINDFYRFFLVPGAAHCSINTAQPHGPFPQHGLAQLIAWVEDGTPPAYLNGSTESGSSTQDRICLWPSRPVWSGNGTGFACETRESGAFIHPLNAWKVEI